VSGIVALVTICAMVGGEPTDECRTERLLNGGLDYSPAVCVQEFERIIEATQLLFPGQHIKSIRCEPLKKDLDA